MAKKKKNEEPAAEEPAAEQAVEQPEAPESKETQQANLDGGINPDAEEGEEVKVFHYWRTNKFIVRTTGDNAEAVRDKPTDDLLDWVREKMKRIKDGPKLMRGDYDSHADKLVKQIKGGE